MSTKRNLTAAFLIEVQKRANRPVIFVEAQFTSGTINLWTGVDTIVWDGKTWTGVGGLGGISSIVETLDVSAKGTILSLAGIPQTNFDLALNEIQPGLPASVYFGAMKPDGTVVVDPFKAFSGVIDKGEIVEGAKHGTIVIALESKLIELQKARHSRYTDEDQQQRFPGDLGFEYVPQLQEKKFAWGRPTGGGTGGGSGSGASGGDSGDRFADDDVF